MIGNKFPYEITRLAPQNEKPSNKVGMIFCVCVACVTFLPHLSMWILWAFMAKEPPQQFNHDPPHLFQLNAHYLYWNHKCTISVRWNPLKINYFNGFKSSENYICDDLNLQDTSKNLGIRQQFATADEITIATKTRCIKFCSWLIGWHLKTLLRAEVCINHLVVVHCNSILSNVIGAFSCTKKQ